MKESTLKQGRKSITSKVSFNFAVNQSAGLGHFDATSLGCAQTRGLWFRRFHTGGKWRQFLPALADVDVWVSKTDVAALCTKF